MILGHIMSLGGVEVRMPPLDNATAKQEPLLFTDEEPLLLTNEVPLGEKLSVESAEKRWPLRA